MLDMGFLPDIKRVLKHLPAKRQTLFFSATMPAPIVTLTKELLHNPATINLERKSTPAVGIRQAVYAVRRGAQGGAVRRAAAPRRRRERDRLHADQAPRQPAGRLPDEARASRTRRSTATARRRSGPRRWRGSSRARYRCLVATDIVARGIDVEQLEHVVNFDVPHLPEDYIHRVGRTARADATGDAFTFVSPEEEADLRPIERAIGKRLPRVVVSGLRLREQAEAALRGADRRADRGDPGAEGGGAEAGKGEGGAPGRAWGGRQRVARSASSRSRVEPRGSSRPARPAAPRTDAVPRRHRRRQEPARVVVGVVAGGRAVGRRGGSSGGRPGGISPSGGGPYR